MAGAYAKDSAYTVDFWFLSSYAHSFRASPQHLRILKNKETQVFNKIPYCTDYILALFHYTQPFAHFQLWASGLRFRNKIDFFFKCIFIIILLLSLHHRNYSYGTGKVFF